MQALEDKVARGGGGGDAPANNLEPLLTCVQCQGDYVESKNAEGYCNYHPLPLQRVGWEYMYVI